MKILYVITGLGGGGAEKVVANLADQMFLKGHEVKIAYLKGDIVVQPGQQELELIYLGLEKPLNFIAAAKKYRDLLDRFKPDVVHAHMVHANIFTRLNRLFYAVPKLICTAHSNNEGGNLRMLAYQYTNWLSDLNTNVSHKATEDFINIKAFNRKAITVYNGIDFSFFKRSEIEANRAVKIILAVGRLNIHKDYPNLLNAIALIKLNNKLNFKLQIAGEGEERENILSLIRQLNLESYVELLGRRDDIPELMSRADVFVLSSEFEGFGLVVAEAMACHTFVVATDCGGVKEVLGNNGLLVPIKSPVALSQAILEALFMSDEERKLNNQNAFEYAQQNFDLNKIVGRWVELYES
ncbi:glycosyltransferase [Acinetobacter proteolyticus]|uniref:glycosyltransferase n=1 Tax=Acinetobacter proteolyticus TaxID=1776741 RepID=UPI00132EDDB2|nr:glycosyltransferase [Acinetobacter gyllenbergii]